MFRTRHLTAVVGATVIATALSACGAGQISQTANQQSAINGSNANVGKLTLRNIRLVGSANPVQQRAGQTAELALVITNESADTDDKLTGIESDIGKVTLSGDTDIPATGRLFVGGAMQPAPKTGPAPGPEVPVTIEPATPNADAISGAAIKHGKAEVLLSKDLADGLTYHFTFDFEKSGSVTVIVPIDAGPNTPRRDTEKPANEEQHH